MLLFACCSRKKNTFGGLRARAAVKRREAIEKVLSTPFQYHQRRRLPFFSFIRAASVLDYDYLDLSVSLQLSLGAFILRCGSSRDLFDPFHSRTPRFDSACLPGVRLACYPRYYFDSLFAITYLLFPCGVVCNRVKSKLIRNLHLKFDLSEHVTLIT